MPFVGSESRPNNILGFPQAENFPVGYSVGYCILVFLANLRPKLAPPWSKTRNFRVRIGRHVGTSPYNRITRVA